MLLGSDVAAVSFYSYIRINNNTYIALFQIDYTIGIFQYCRHVRCDKTFLVTNPNYQRAVLFGYQDLGLTRLYYYNSIRALYIF